MPEPALSPQPLYRRRQEVIAQVESADDKRRRAEEARVLGVEPVVVRRPLQARQYPGCVPQWISVGVDGEDTRVFGARVSQPL
jgi:hypothetical protein